MADRERRTALERFLVGVERRALRLAEIATGEREAALDIVQDAMAKLAERYGSRPAAEWGPLFQRILQSRIRDWWRRDAIRRRWRAWLGPQSPEDDDDAGDAIAATIAAAPGYDPETRLQNQQALAAVERALRELPLRQQQVFLLRAWEGLDVAATAAAMGCSEGSVKTHYFRALDKLRERLGAHR